MRNNVSNLGIDLAKNVFQLYGNNERETRAYSKRLSRQELVETIANLPRCTIGMEACGGAHHWARKFESFGHQVKLMSPQYVKPYVKTNKNDKNDAEGIYEAMRRKTMRFVPVKQVNQQDIQNIHNVYQRLMKEKTMLMNQMRGMLSEYGVVVGLGQSRLEKELPRILEDGDNELSVQGRGLMQELGQELKELTKKISVYEGRLAAWSKMDERCQLIESIPGIGVMTSTALISFLGNGYKFDRGRGLGAFLGLVPRQNSSAEHQRLGRISKRGNTYIRTLLVHGARSVVISYRNKDTQYGRWIKQLIQKCGWNRTVVAVANKNARMVWAVLTSGEPYKAEKAFNVKSVKPGKKKKKSDVKVH